MVIYFIYPDDKSIGPVDCNVGVAATVVGTLGLFNTLRSYAIFINREDVL